MKVLDVVPLCLSVATFARRVSVRDDLEPLERLSEDRSSNTTHWRDEVDRSSNTTHQRDGLNSLLTMLWPNIRRAVAKIMKEQVAPMLEGYKVTLHSFSLGPEPARLEKMAIWKDSLNRYVELLMDLVYDMEASAFDLVRISYKKMPASVSKMFFKAELVVRLGPIMDDFPLFGGVSVYFRKVPEIDFRVGGVAGPLKKQIDKALKQHLGDTIVSPWGFPITLGRKDQGVDYSYFNPLTPIGVMRVYDASRFKPDQVYLESKPYNRVFTVHDRYFQATLRKPVENIQADYFESPMCPSPTDYCGCNSENAVGGLCLATVRLRSIDVSDTFIYNGKKPSPRRSPFTKLGKKRDARFVKDTVYTWQGVDYLYLTVEAYMAESLNEAKKCKGPHVKDCCLKVCSTLDSEVQNASCVEDCVSRKTVWKQIGDTVRFENYYGIIDQGRSARSWVNVQYSEHWEGDARDLLNRDLKESDIITCANMTKSEYMTARSFRSLSEALDRDEFQTLFPIQIREPYSITVDFGLSMHFPFPSRAMREAGNQAQIVLRVFHDKKGMLASTAFPTMSFIRQLDGSKLDQVRRLLLLVPELAARGAKISADILVSAEALRKRPKPMFLVGTGKEAVFDVSTLYPNTAKHVKMMDINTIIKEIWPKLPEAIARMIEKDINPMVSAAAKETTGGILDVGIPEPIRDNFKLGAQTPVIDPVHLRKDESNDFLQFNVGIRFKSSNDFVMKVTVKAGEGMAAKILTLGSQTDFGITNVEFSGEMIIRLTHILDEMPVIGGVSIYFVDRPQFKFDWATVSTSNLIQALSAPPQVDSFIRGAINDQISANLVLDSSIATPVAAGKVVWKTRDGYRVGSDLRVPESERRPMTIENAKRVCMGMRECVGFCHEGMAINPDDHTSRRVNINFKAAPDVSLGTPRWSRPHRIGWTTYLHEKLSAADLSNPTLVAVLKVQVHQVTDLEYWTRSWLAEKAASWTGAESFGTRAMVKLSVGRKEWSSCPGDEGNTYKWSVVCNDRAKNDTHAPQYTYFPVFDEAQSLDIHVVSYGNLYSIPLGAKRVGIRNLIQGQPNTPEDILLEKIERSWMTEGHGGPGSVKLSFQYLPTGSSHGICKETSPLCLVQIKFLTLGMQPRQALEIARQPGMKGYAYGAVYGNCGHGGEFRTPLGNVLVPMEGDIEGLPRMSIAQTWFFTMEPTSAGHRMAPNQSNAYGNVQCLLRVEDARQQPLVNEQVDFDPSHHVAKQNAEGFAVSRPLFFIFNDEEQHVTVSAEILLTHLPV